MNAAEQQSWQNWNSYKGVLEADGVFQRIDELVDQHCSDWYDRLQKLFPLWDLGSQENAVDRLLQILEGHSQIVDPCLQRGSGQNRRYDSMIC